ncbi:NAD(P)/FAD-dependent oxidoreductase [Micromonospora sp. KC606]|uniref:NAD(P)/FAD-dependent oxidoreductase n=1 Tax=Micromonospora sp. KC606 TaxID=2530379 RepID=UPI0010522830|nr:FAD-dependent oxidoreductase [Micromonospora sp. KC606]TDC84224.1 NAD(P)/FAD-dependent oxidoreductase [Micromonospora sp. KC606]
MTAVLVVVGHGMVGHRLVQELRSRDTAGRWRVVVLGEENRPAYDRTALSSYLDGKSAHDLTLLGHDLLHDSLVEWRFGVRVTHVDRVACLVTTSDGASVRYDALVLATGSRPFVPPIPGRDLPGCFVYRTLDDLDLLRAAAAPDRPGVVIGGGLLGLEAANALRLLGMRPRVVEMAPHLMPAQIDPDAGRLLGDLVGRVGITAHCGVATQRVEAGADGRVRAVKLSDGSTIEADVVVFSAGVRARDDLADGAGLPRGERGGFLVDDRCRTPDPHIWAVGECAAVNGRVYGLVVPGYRMADAVAAVLLGQGDAAFPGADMSTKLKLFGVDVASFGDAHGRTEGAWDLVYADEDAGTYARLVLAADDATLLGGVLVGDAAAYPVLRPLIGHRLPAAPEYLLRARS